jgi:hypothetical protein
MVRPARDALEYDKLGRPFRSEQERQLTGTPRTESRAQPQSPPSQLTAYTAPTTCCPPTSCDCSVRSLRSVSSALVYFVAAKMSSNRSLSTFTGSRNDGEGGGHKTPWQTEDVMAAYGSPGTSALVLAHRTTWAHAPTLHFTCPLAATCLALR